MRFLGTCPALILDSPFPDSFSDHHPRRAPRASEGGQAAHLNPSNLVASGSLITFLFVPSSTLWAHNGHRCLTV